MDCERWFWRVRTEIFVSSWGLDRDRRCIFIFKVDRWSLAILAQHISFSFMITWTRVNALLLSDIQGWQRSRLNRSWRLRKCNRWQNFDWLCNRLRNLDWLGILTIKLSLIYIFIWPRWYFPERSLWEDHNGGSTLHGRNNSIMPLRSSQRDL